MTWALAAGLLVALAVLLAAPALTPESVTLAVVGAATFADLTRRGLAERGRGWNDPTDVGMSVAFALILIAAAWELDRGPLARLAGSGRLALLGIGAALIGGGWWLRQRAARELGASFLVRLGIREGHQLVRTGPYRHIRHPTYTALLAVAVGTSLALASLFALAVTFGVWLPVVLVRVAREERLLAEAFGQDFRDYREATWRLLPGVF